MSIEIRGSSDDILEQMVPVLRMYRQAHPRAQIVLYRQNSYSVRIRIVDPDFRGLEKSERHAEAWRYLEQLPHDVISEISMLVLLAPGEEGRSVVNWEFDDPIPSQQK